MSAADASRRCWRRIVLVLFAVAFGPNVFIPILVLYRRRLGLTATSVTSIFATYAAGLIVALLFAGSAADRIGRRRVTLPAAAASAAASLVFIPAADSEGILYAARFIQGVATGAVFSAGSAWLVETTERHRADLAARRASVAMNAGFAAGPLTAGVLGQFAPDPTVLPYLAHVALVVVAVAACRVVPETLREPNRGELLRVRVAPERRRLFWAVLTPIAFSVFIFPSTGISTLPIFLAPRTGPVLYVGVIAGVTLGAAAVASPLARVLGSRAGPVGLVLGAAGFALGVAAEETAAWPLALPVAVLLGAAAGLCLTAGLTVTQVVATDETRGAVNAVFYTFAYLGFAVPVIVTAAAGQHLTVPFALLAVAMIGLAGWLVVEGRRAVPARDGPLA